MLGGLRRAIGSSTLQTEPRCRPRTLLPQSHRISARSPEPQRSGCRRLRLWAQRRKHKSPNRRVLRQRWYFRIMELLIRYCPQAVQNQLSVHLLQIAHIPCSRLPYRCGDSPAQNAGGQSWEKLLSQMPPERDGRNLRDFVPCSPLPPMLLFLPSIEAVGQNIKDAHKLFYGMIRNESVEKEGNLFLFNQLLDLGNVQEVLREDNA